MGLKAVLYDRPYENPVRQIGYEGFYSDRGTGGKGAAACRGAQVQALFAMTPYYWKTPADGAARLARQTVLETPSASGFGVSKAELKRDTERPRNHGSGGRSVQLAKVGSALCLGHGQPDLAAVASRALIALKIQLNVRGACVFVAGGGQPLGKKYAFAAPASRPAAGPHNRRSPRWRQGSQKEKRSSGAGWAEATAM